MAGLEELKKKLVPLFDGDKGPSDVTSMDPSASYMVSDGGTVNLLSRSCGVYNINELGLQKRTSGLIDDSDASERTYRCASHEMCIFGAIGCGASSVVQRAIHIPSHRILALKRINIFEKEKRQQLLNEIRTLCEAPCYQGLVEFHGAFYTPHAGQISIALEYMDGGSLADVLRLQKFIPEPLLSCMVQKLLNGLSYLHGVRHLVHRDIKPANLLINLKGEPKITDFGISAGLENSVAMCATFVGTVTYMSPERIRNESYSYPADIWSLGLALFECGTGEFPYTANDGPVNLMLQVANTMVELDFMNPSWMKEQLAGEKVLPAASWLFASCVAYDLLWLDRWSERSFILEDPSPSPPKGKFSPEFCSFIDACLQKDADARPTAEQLLLHPFIRKHDKTNVDLAAFVQSVFDPTQRLKDLADMLTVHYYMLFDGPDELWHHTKTFYNQDSTFSFSGKRFLGPNDIFMKLSNIRRTLAGDQPREKLVHVVENLQCRAHGKDGVAIRISGSFITGTHFLICGKGVQAEGMPSFQDLNIDLASKRMGTFHEQFIMEPGSVIGCFFIAEQELYIHQ